ncbi:cysteine desulfurase family protein [Haloglycomyces albus]|uniref:cysteine desulfurase family protein n=1 Tax=Haloglycomyces albus TaxID=526067 RepID=UPI0004A40F56|nr:aminotransferase class V-fold PLP-dependent enzyme [Haloglycomyces albus]
MDEFYFDAATAMPPSRAAREAYAAALNEGWAGPGRLYTLGRRSRMLLDAARQSVAESLNVRADEVTFTSSGSQAVHYGLLGMAHGLGRDAEILSSQVEHSAVLHAAAWYADRGGTTDSIPVDRLGRIDLGVLPPLGDDPSVVAVQSANHEVGTRQPLSTLRHRLDGRPWVCDAAASLPWEPVEDGWSVLTGSARKWGGLAGCGIMVVRTGSRWRLPFPGDDASPQEAVGEVNVPAAVAAAAGLRHAVEQRRAQADRVRALAEQLRNEISETVTEVEMPGDPDDCLPNIVTFSCLGVDGEVLLTELNREGFSVSSGSACASNRFRPSHVLSAMGVLSHGNVRLSLHYDTTEAEIDQFLNTLPKVVNRLRALGRD